MRALMFDLLALAIAAWTMPGLFRLLVVWVVR